MEMRIKRTLYFVLALLSRLLVALETQKGFKHSPSADSSDVSCRSVCVCVEVVEFVCWC